MASKFLYHATIVGDAVAIEKKKNNIFSLGKQETWTEKYRELKNRIISYDTTPLVELISLSWKCNYHAFKYVDLVWEARGLSMCCANSKLSNIEALKSLFGECNTLNACPGRQENSPFRNKGLVVY